MSLRTPFLLAFLALTACSKTPQDALPSSASATPEPSTSAIVPSPSTASSATAPPVVAATASVVPTATSAKATAATTASSAHSAPSTPLPSAAPAAAPVVASVTASAVAPPPAKPVASRISGSHFTVDFVAPGDCKSGARCGASLTLRATEGYHINDAYPYKLVATDTPNVDFLGKEGKTYSKAGGEFVKTGETTARMNMPFQAKSPGKAHISGTFKMSVCSESNCQIESPTVALDVPID